MVGAVVELERIMDGLRVGKSDDALEGESDGEVEVAALVEEFVGAWEGNNVGLVVLRPSQT